MQDSTTLSTDKTQRYTLGELMVAAAAREIRDGEVVFVGMRLPLIAFVVAKHTHAPNAVGLFEMIESVDSLGLAQEINKWAEKEAKTMPVLLEVNVAGEASKFGFKPEQLKSALEHVAK